MPLFVPGQRWISDHEPELGLGIVLHVDERSVGIAFRGSDVVRQYATETAPLRRMTLRIGDTVSGTGGESFVVSEIDDIDGLVTYKGDGRAMSESELDDHAVVDSAGERLCRGQLERSGAFDLRYATLQHRQRIQQSNVRGFVGARIQLLPHQLFVAQEVSGRPMPRVLLADEVGLGKTVEAALIVHRLLLTGRAARVLIIVPEALVHQWFVELLRRFNLHFSIYDDDRCNAISGDVSSNPFMAEQLVLCSIDLLLDKTRRQHVLAADWDVLVVDEAHRLHWTPVEASPEYNVVAALAAIAPAVLLLTATPEQLGLAGHYARLRLLDPGRYPNLHSFEAETVRFADVAAVASELIDESTLSSALRTRLHTLFPDLPGDVAPDVLLDMLLDRHGVGRVMFRNVRAGMTGFPSRLPNLIALSADDRDVDWRDRLMAEFSGVGNGADYRLDSRVVWLAKWLRKHRSRKVLLICESCARVKAVEGALRTLVNVRMGVFHEELPLLQRDRNAAWFAEADGAQVLLCSEIGGEGRNFQFARDLVLFDLPSDPEIVEQRIGRLDRIGQHGDIVIHVPYIIGSPQEVVARWYNEGVSVFSRCVPGAAICAAEFRDRLRGLAMSHGEASDSVAALEVLLTETRRRADSVNATLAAGRDRLLELNSCRPAVADVIVDAVATVDGDRRLDDYFLALAEHFGIQVDEQEPRTFLLNTGNLFSDELPPIVDGMTVTLSRKKALSRDDIGFLSWDHPLVVGGMDALLRSPAGISTFALWPDPDCRHIYLEMVFVLECVAPASLHIERFLPQTPIRVVIDHQMVEQTEQISTKQLAKSLTDGHGAHLFEAADIGQTLLPPMLEMGTSIAEKRITTMVAEAAALAEGSLGPECARLAYLNSVNASVSSDEVAALARQLADIKKHLDDARMRLDATRLIWRAPVQN